jgi:hypothetical protein
MQPGEDVEAEVAAAFGPFVVLLGQHGADEADQGIAAGEDPDGSCPSECPSRAARSPVLNSNYAFELGGAKRARTADLLHAMNHPHVHSRHHTLRQLHEH